jgi:hypothetical protein
MAGCKISCDEGTLGEALIYLKANCRVRHAHHESMSCASHIAGAHGAPYKYQMIRPSSLELDPADNVFFKVLRLDLFFTHGPAVYRNTGTVHTLRVA